MSERGARELPTRRSSFRRQLHDAPLPPQYRAQLEERRKQLDESIHKYIASKERDYKAFEKELRQQHKAAQGQNGDGDRRRSPSDASQHDEKEAHARANGAPTLSAISRWGSNSSEATDDTTETRDYALVDRSTIAGLTDRRASLDRDRDFAGLFTPPYLSAIDDRNGRDVEEQKPLHSSSVPNESALESQANIEHLRANSDSVTQARPKRPSHLALVQRTSSSGSSADGKLTSALKSPSQLPKQPKQKRVSLAVGDAIVAPSDSVPAAASSSNTPSHSRQRSSGSRRVLTTLSTETSQSSITSEDIRNPQASAYATGEVASADATARDPSSNDSTMPNASKMTGKRETLTTPSAQNKLDPDGDLFDLEEIENAPMQHDEHDDLDSPLESEIEDEEADMRVEADNLIDDVELNEHRLKYDPREGLIPEPEDGHTSAVPYLEFQPGSSVASQQPTHPGFRRPSVSDDPIYRGRDYKDAERKAVEDDIYGSSFNRPASKGSFTAGSLGESYMAAHAAEMERMRAARKQTVVKT